MFGAIADRYDLMNRVMTLGMDGKWRRDAADHAALSPGDRALDVACGTGDLTFELARRVVPTGSATGIDFTQEMLGIARRKAAATKLPVRFEYGDALDIPFPDGSFTAATCAFGLRNMEDRPRALREMTRVVAPKGRVVILELTPPTNPLARAYMDTVVPRLGQVLARARDAYSYLPASAEEFLDAPALAALMQRAGLVGIGYRFLNLGTVALHWGTKPD